MKIRQTALEADLVIVGAGIAGMCAAVAAARNGIKVLIVNDRPMPGGNASSEVRMWIAGAHGAENKETGLLEELLLANYYRNPTLKYTVWDHVMYDFLISEPNIRLLLNVTIDDVSVSGNRITAISGWGLTDYTRYTMTGKLFADCSGDGILRLSGAEFRRGREAASEFNESYAPAVADDRTMGNSIMIQLRRTKHHRPFIAPEWAYHFDDKTFLRRDFVDRELRRENFWWMEFGGIRDTIADADAIRHELLRIAYGVWEYMKNHDWRGASGWELDWIGSLPGKRESIRYVGDHIMSQTEIEGGGRYPDVVAHGGWTMDDHHPEAFFTSEPPNIFHPSAPQFGIPYRSLYSKNIDNLFFAGRDISTTHMAMSAIRVMATCGVMGQAVGTAAALAVRRGLSPRELGRRELELLQSTLLDQDQLLPGRVRRIPELTRQARATHEVLRDGIDRDCGGVEHGARLSPGQAAVYELGNETELHRVRLVFDSDLADTKRQRNYTADDGEDVREMPAMLARDFRIEIRRNGTWQIAAEIRDNPRRLVFIDLAGMRGDAVRLVAERAWKAELPLHVFGFEVQ